MWRGPLLRCPRCGNHATCECSGNTVGRGGRFHGVRAKNPCLAECFHGFWINPKTQRIEEVKGCGWHGYLPEEPKA